ncbi:hypothetical protein FF36_00351 [Frankia torreyi]|uniref:DUF4386 domain-containing protein n=1 Tax=Frankia torreyi TaxID=1856 RepID=A0A0D8BLX7_9ACTN|nr:MULTISPECIES: hypothetical protein [Frankia]KJE25218.1 hypothetical protein FF36_00351 [Frankia torreyi]KQM07966.1 hypothetical protein FF86_1001222 [Frankia sp. CpI1-P]
MTIAARSGRQGGGGPPLGILAVVFTALLVAGLAVSTAMAGGDIFPSPFSSSPTILAYFHDHRDPVRVSAFLQFAASVPLAIYAATVSARLRTLGVRVPGPTIALAGGVVAATMLALCGLVSWVLARPDVLDEPAVVRALHDLAFVTGGTGHVVFLGLLVAGVAVPGLLAGLLPRPLAVAGLVVATIAELSTITLLVSDAAVLLPLARFTALAWLVATGFLLPRTRATRANRATRAGTNI